MICPQCRDEFVPRRPDQVYCKPVCRLAHYQEALGDGGLRAPIKTVRRMANGGVSVLGIFPPEAAQNAFSLLPGAVVEIVGAVRTTPPQ
jgi:hypothetical protein